VDGLYCLLVAFLILRGWLIIIFQDIELCCHISLKNVFDGLLTNVHSVAIECKILNHEPPEAGSDHFYHQLVKHIHVSLQRTQLDNPLQFRFTTALRY